jgi:UDP-MurNAc hydroxylase
LGPLDGLFLQFSGAIWYPFAYDLSPAVMQDLGRTKRRNEMARARSFIQALNPTYVFPSAGPPTFLDEGLFEWNDFNNDETNPFPDQTVFLQELERHGVDGGQLVLPGSEIFFKSGDLSVHHHLAGETLDSIFGDKRAYLERYRARMAPVLAEEHQRWPAVPDDLFDQVKRRLEPIMALADVTARQIGGDIILDWDTGGARLDFRRRRVVPWDGKPARYYFHLHGPTLTLAVQAGEVDWVNSLFLSFRFQARREGEYNEAVYTFFKCLSPERIEYAEGYWLEAHAEDELFATHGYLVQRRCPHLKADLERFGVVDESNVLTCQMHGWQFDLATGRCLNADDRQLYRRPIVDGDPSR